MPTPTPTTPREDDDELLTPGQKRFVSIVAVVVILLFLPLLFMAYVQPHLPGRQPVPQQKESR